MLKKYIFFFESRYCYPQRILQDSYAVGIYDISAIINDWVILNGASPHIFKYFNLFIQTLE